MDIATKYNPKETEDKWYNFWLEKNYFRAEPKSEKEPFCMVIPPPNVTGSLHLGHALNNTLQDALIRYQRMQGKNTLWLPGTDHAGIATQNVVERELKKEGLKRQDLGREKFVERVWQWKEKTGDTIIKQLKKLGCSCDWSRQRFTMEEDFIHAVQEEFITLYDQGYIYRGNYIVNWCPRCHTALSDIEAEHKDIKGHLYHIKYFLSDTGQRSTTDGFIVVATTRPETIFGDVAIAVNPKDKRYKKLIGQKVKVPSPCGGREIPIIADSYVDMKFGTGALKITPAHDPADFEIGKKHDLETIVVIDSTAKMNEHGLKYKGLDRFECRKALVEDLQNEGYIEKLEDYTLSMGVCSRCSTFVEPHLSLQWFVKMKELAKPAIKAVKDGKIKFVPKSWEKTYYRWMDEIKDWCISRQLWWGHRIPVWYCENKDCPPVASITNPGKCAKCGSTNFVQDEDVLDTWFSSDLWPFATLGWPKKTDDLKTFYPTSVLSTAFDIIFFWVARMIIMGIHFMKDVPFKTVYIHALVRDPEGKKMSKSKGNVVDPLEVLDRFGTDALRFTLAVLAVKGRDIYFSEERVEGYRNFMNKIWNASRFIMMNIQMAEQRCTEYRVQGTECEIQTSENEKLTLADKWIISRLNGVTKEITSSIEKYDYDKAALAAYEFFWHEFCDWYLEIAKIQMSDAEKQKCTEYRVQGAECQIHIPEKENDKIAKQPNNQQPATSNISANRRTTCDVLLRVLEQSLRLMHPIIPFITEDIWQTLKAVASCRLQVAGESIMIAEWPKYNKKEVSAAAEKEMISIQEVVTAIRNIRSELGIVPLARIKAFISFKDEEEEKHAKILKKNSAYIKFLAGIEELEISKTLTVEKPFASAVIKKLEIRIPLKGVIDFAKEKERLNKELEKAKQDMQRIEEKLSNKNFSERAPKEVIDQEIERKGEIKAKIEKLSDNLKKMEE